MHSLLLPIGISMNLKWHLISRIILIALLCLLATVAYALYHTNQQARQEARRTAETIAKQLEFQLLRINAGFGQPERFPDFDLWQQTSRDPGICIRYVTVKGKLVRSICMGDTTSSRGRPELFAILYRWLHHPDIAVTQAISFNGLLHGKLQVVPSVEMAIAHAWEVLYQLIGLMFITLLAVCTLVYVSISRALRPAHVIIAGLENIKQGELSCRLPNFELIEWQRTATAINQLVSSQQQLLAERQQLTVQLMTAQEEERRYLARELHDELGQCLTAINAVATSIRQTAKRHCPDIATDANQISRISQHIMDNVRSLLIRLRPADIDELGLSASLDGLVSEWNSRSQSCRYHFVLHGDCTNLLEPLPMALYRITQECLTNIARHASATCATVTLNVRDESLTLSIDDNGIGIAEQLPQPNKVGMGLLGIRERITALDGRLTLTIAKPSGLILQCWLPIPSVCVLSG